MARQVRYLYRDDVGGIVDVSARQASRILKQLPGAQCHDGVHYRVRDCQEVRVALELYRLKSSGRGGRHAWLVEFRTWAAMQSFQFNQLPRLYGAKAYQLPRLYGAKAYRQLAAEADRLLDQIEPVREFFEKVEGWRRQALAEAQKRSASPRGTARR